MDLGFLFDKELDHPEKFFQSISGKSRLINQKCLKSKYFYNNSMY